MTPTAIPCPHCEIVVDSQDSLAESRSDFQLHVLQCHSEQRNEDVDVVITFTPKGLDAVRVLCDSSGNSISEEVNRAMEIYRELLAPENIGQRVIIQSGDITVTVDVEQPSLS